MKTKSMGKQLAWSCSKFINRILSVMLKMNTNRWQRWKKVTKSLYYSFIPLSKWNKTLTNHFPFSGSVLKKRPKSILYFYLIQFTRSGRYLYFLYSVLATLPKLCWTQWSKWIHVAYNANFYFSSFIWNNWNERMNELFLKVSCLWGGLMVYFDRFQ